MTHKKTLQSIDNFSIVFHVGHKLVLVFFFWPSSSAEATSVIVLSSLSLSRHRGCVRAYPLVPTVHCTSLSLYPFYFPSSSKSFCFSREKKGEGTRNSAGARARALLVAIHKLRAWCSSCCGPSCPSTPPRACREGRCRIFRHVGRAGVVGSLHWDWLIPYDYEQYQYQHLYI